jgi:hypothetical protein
MEHLPRRLVEAFDQLEPAELVRQTGERTPHLRAVS